YQARKTYAEIFKPIFGASATSSGSAYVFAGIAADIRVGDNFAITPSFAPGLYAKGGGLDLGHVIEFRSQIELSYILEDSSRLGLAVSHRSNAGIGDRNPGEETASIYYSMPFHKLGDW
ncbi:MAG: acyloxyacyl hydrolase, partial [Rhodospirillales bacterium]|nr:acyloxyacyl hydrolase [Rhodospirillales bacterium]